jgi:hypothetical protein
MKKNSATKGFFRSQRLLLLVRLASVKGVERILSCVSWALGLTSKPNKAVGLTILNQSTGREATGRKGAAYESNGALITKRKMGKRKLTKTKRAKAKTGKVAPKKKRTKVSEKPTKSRKQVAGPGRAANLELGSDLPF